MKYRLEFEYERIWQSFHHDHRTHPPLPMERRFEPKFIWYLGDTSIPLSPYFASLGEARHWFELHQAPHRIAQERRKSTGHRRASSRFAAVAFASRFDRRRYAGRRWKDQVAQFCF